MDKKPLLTLATYQTGLSSPKGFCGGVYAKGSYSIPQGFSPAITKISLSTCKTTLPHSVTLTNLDKTDRSLSKSIVKSPKNFEIPKIIFQKRQTTNSIETETTMANKTKSCKTLALNDDSDEKRNNLGHYLNYLSTSSQEDLDTFRKKMKPKTISAKVKVKTQEEKESWIDKLIRHDPKDKMNSTQQSGILSPKVAKLPSLYVNLQIDESVDENLASTPGTAKRTVTFGASKLKPVITGFTYTDRQALEKNKFYSTTKDNPVASKLAGDINHNYKLLQENQSTARETRKRIQDIFENEGVVNVLVSKEKKQSTLLLRVYNDMVENTEVISALRRMDSKVSVSSAKTPLHHNPFSNARLIPEKYEIYKRINSNLEEIILEYKIQGLKRLGSSLFKAREDLKTKEKDLRHQRGCTNQGYLFNRAESQTFEESLISLNYDNLGEKIDRLQRNYGDSVKVDEAKKLVNKELNNIMANYATKLRGGERVNSIC